jgi:predicted permease
MESLIRDIRYGFRSLFKSPGSSLIALIVLGLGIGANTAVFSVLDAILLRPLPYPDPGRLVAVWGSKISKNIRHEKVSAADYHDFVVDNQVFDQLGAFKGRPAVITGGELPERVEIAEVTPSLLVILGLRPSAGRPFVAEEDQPSRNKVAIISDGIWRRRFGADPDITGKTVKLDGQAYQIVGLAPPGFRLIDTPSEIWIPYTTTAADLSTQKRGFRFLTVLGHLKPGVSLEQARSGMASVAKQLEETYPDTNVGFGVEVVPLAEQMTGAAGSTVWALTGAAAFVLLIACANVANLLLARVGLREKEMAVRSALGGSPGQLLRQLLIESLLLALAGGVVGLVVAWWSIKLLVRYAPANLPRAGEISLDGQVLLFTLAMSIFTGILFGLAPALAGARQDLNSLMKSSGRSATGQRSQTRTRGLLVVCEIAVSVALLSGAGLLMRSFLSLSQVDPGFRVDHLLTMQISLPAPRYTDLHVAQFFQRLLDEVSSLPGVDSAGLCRFLPLGGADASLNFQIEGRPQLEAVEQPRAKYRTASPGYFVALGIPVIRGRAFELGDNERTPKVVVLNEAAASQYWRNENPVGKRILSGADESAWSTVIGVVGNVKHTGLDVATNPETFYNYLQVPQDQMSFIESTMSLVVLSRTDPNAMAAAIRREVGKLDPDQPVFNVKSMEEVVAGSVEQPHFRTLLLGLFAVVALLLTTIGLYGVISYSVSQRTSEFGIRSALGASPGDVLWLVVRQGARLAAIGIGFGLLMALALVRFLKTLLFGVSPMDPITFAGTILLIFVVALAASYIPALRATKIDPVEALRAE